MADNQKKKKPKTKVRSFRMEIPLSDALDELASEYDMTPSQVFRLLVSHNLEKVMGRRLYVEREQGEQILKTVRAAGDTLNGLRYEINKIGVNYNQDVKVRNMQRKDAELTKKIQETNDTLLTESLLAQQWKLRSEMEKMNTVPGGGADGPQLVKQWLDRFDVKAKEVSDALWHIQE